LEGLIDKAHFLFFHAMLWWQQHHLTQLFGRLQRRNQLATRWLSPWPEVYSGRNHPFPASPFLLLFPVEVLLPPGDHSFSPSFAESVSNHKLLYVGLFAVNVSSCRCNLQSDLAAEKFYQKNSR
jgi:hypothetical protein